MTGAEPVIRTEGLTKRFGQITAVDGLDLEVREGDVYGFLGANGSGKTTTVRMLLGLVLATSGRIEVLGEEMPRAARRVLPQVGAHGRGTGGLPAPVRAPQPRALRRDGTRRLAGPRARPGSSEALGPGRAGPRRRPAGARLLARNAAAARAGRRPAPPTSAAGPRRADQRPRPAGHPRDPRAAARPQRGRHHGLPLQPPARRGRADVHPGRRPRPRPAGAPGPAGRAAEAHRAGGGAHPGRLRGAGAAGRRRRAVRRRAAAGALRRPGRAQRRAGLGRRPRHHAHRRAAPPRGHRAGGHQRRVGPVRRRTRSHAPQAEVLEQ